MSGESLGNAVGQTFGQQTQAIAELAKELLNRAAQTATEASLAAKQQATLAQLVTPKVSQGYLDSVFANWSRTADTSQRSADASFMAGAAAALNAGVMCVQAAPSQFVVLPRRLTAENGAKYTLLGEFHETVERTCPECDDDEDEDSTCELCGGTGTLLEKVPVGWDTIKRIHDAVVAHFAPQSGASTIIDSDNDGVVVSATEFEAFQAWRTGGSPSVTAAEVVAGNSLPAEPIVAVASPQPVGPLPDPMSALSTLFQSVAAYSLSEDEGPQANAQMAEAHEMAQEVLDAAAGRGEGAAFSALKTLAVAVAAELAGANDFEKLGEAQNAAFEVINAAYPPSVGMGMYTLGGG